MQIFLSRSTLLLVLLAAVGVVWGAECDLQCAENADDLRDALTTLLTSHDCARHSDCGGMGYCSANKGSCAPYKKVGEACNAVKLCAAHIPCEQGECGGPLPDPIPVSWDTAADVALIPEGIASRGEEVYIGSATGQGVRRLNADGTTELLAPTVGVGLLGLKLDQSRLVAARSDYFLGGSTSGFMVYNLDRGAANHILCPDAVFINDVVRLGGAYYATDTLTGTLYRWELGSGLDGCRVFMTAAQGGWSVGDAAALTINGLAGIDDDNLLVASLGDERMFRVHLPTQTSTPLENSENGCDGMLFEQGEYVICATGDVAQLSRLSTDYQTLIPVEEYHFECAQPTTLSYGAEPNTYRAVCVGDDPSFGSGPNIVETFRFNSLFM